MTEKNNAAVVIGGVNMDIWGRPAIKLVLHDSAPGFVSMTPGGVGRNIAHNLCLLGLNVGLVAALGDDANGAVTIGTLDGANVEMYERLGDENMFLFGLHTDEIAKLRMEGYDPASIVANDAELKRITDRISNGFADGKSYSDLISNLIYGGDPYMLIADFRAYADCQKKLYNTIADTSELGRLSIMNTAQSGFFAADRAIREYAKEIWHIED